MSFVPVTPGGTVLTDLAANTRDKAINRLLIDASHMPYGTWENFERRGYVIKEYPNSVIQPLRNPDWIQSGKVLSHADKERVLIKAGRVKEIK